MRISDWSSDVCFSDLPNDLQRDLSVARAVYAASAAQDGATEAGKEFDEARFENAMRAVVGEVAEVGGSRVTVPWGVPRKCSKIAPRAWPGMTCSAPAHPDTRRGGKGRALTG